MQRPGPAATCPRATQRLPRVCSVPCSLCLINPSHQEPPKQGGFPGTKALLGSSAAFLLPCLSQGFVLLTTSFQPSLPPCPGFLPSALPGTELPRPLGLSLKQAGAIPLL